MTVSVTIFNDEPTSLHVRLGTHIFPPNPPQTVDEVLGPGVTKEYPIQSDNSFGFTVVATELPA